ncbi:MAG TPA: hypothetical protein VLD19_14765, partial [Chitinophagaceae bacterium]|nr:hypothetical protein [Chitinophagaceae bacterium]
MSCTLYCQSITPDPHYHLLSGGNFVQSKNYYLLTLLQEDKAVRHMLETDTVLSALATAREEQLKASLKECGYTASCYTERMKFSEPEIAAIGQRLLALYSGSNALGKLVQSQLIPSGTYILFKDLSPQEQLVKAWEQDANGINFTIGVYAEGKKANYPLIDSIAFNTKDNRLSGLVYTTAYTLLSENNGNRLFFSLPMKSALQFLELNERNRAADYE